ncbi:dethiobiotin synthase [Helicobacter enhydrae]|uniref:ATP-dependent dethiobiotin synthetase BioD n=1 Tax=Helicobacter enhydrae TaxID=222136 RepID=A0A1B1U491_9HELI|nr:dethiobiotin synthase [Helicobacter enhydrae]ANV97576.1 dethiobiotin synthase [Helicobacter enhydrae]
MRVFFVTGSDTNVGKTYVTSALVKLLNQRGHKSVALKPIETGVSGMPLDSMLHLETANSLGYNLTLPQINQYAFALPASPYCADVEHRICVASLLEHIERFQDFDYVFVEGAGGLFVPILEDYFMLDFAKDLQERFQGETLFVCDTHLGMINRLLSARYILQHQGICSHFYLNCLDTKEFEQISLPFLREAGIEYTCTLDELSLVIG